MVGMIVSAYVVSIFFFNDTATTEIYTLSLHDALPILSAKRAVACDNDSDRPLAEFRQERWQSHDRSEEHTSELQSLRHLVCRLLLEKKKIENRTQDTTSITGTDFGTDTDKSMRNAN